MRAETLCRVERQIPIGSIVFGGERGWFARRPGESPVAHKRRLMENDRLYGDAADKRKVPNYAKAMKRGERFPPVLAFKDRDGIYVADGFHRCAGTALGRQPFVAHHAPGVTYSVYVNSKT